jgi:hypothetical protein
MAQARNYKDYPYTEDKYLDLEYNDPSFVPPHKAYLGIYQPFNRDQWQPGDPLFEHNIIDKEKALEDLRITEDVFSNKGKNGKDRSFFAHLYEGDIDGGLHHRAEAITPRKITFVERSKRFIGERGIFRIDAYIDGVLKSDNIMFPDNWTREDVLLSVLEAYINAKYLENNKFVGEDQYGFEVLIAINNDDFTIQTAMPYEVKMHK